MCLSCSAVSSPFSPTTHPHTTEAGTHTKLKTNRQAKGTKQQRPQTHNNIARSKPGDALRGPRQHETNLYALVVSAALQAGRALQQAPCLAVAVAMSILTQAPYVETTANSTGSLYNHRYAYKQQLSLLCLPVKTTLPLLCVHAASRLCCAIIVLRSSRMQYLSRGWGVVCTGYRGRLLWLLDLEGRQSLRR